ncbi:STAS domain-containing protein, partial [Candidatus Bipolaricaulota bacterium]|nr:STAS domain-containing protein [Candidatus Bipolaricaulota bacterium]
LPPYKKPHMPARSSPQKIGDVTVVKLEHEDIWQKTDAGDVFDQLVARVRRRPRPKLLLDFSRVQNLSGAFAMGGIIMLHRETLMRRGQLVLANLQQPVMNFCQITHLDKFFDIRQGKLEDICADMGGQARVVTLDRRLAEET